jgi:hypothetical protein
MWRNVGDAGGRTKYVDSDGVNFRLANVTGCVVGATVTSGGQNYTSAPTVAVASGGATFAAILGPYVSSVTVTNGGSNYTYPPNVIIQAPSGAGTAAGVQATAVSTISNGAVSTVTMIDQGAGYTFTPTINLVNDTRDTTGNGAAATPVLAGSGQVVALICTNHGTATGISTAGVLPGITFSGGGGTSAAAIPLMAWTVTSLSASTSGAGYGSNVMMQAISSGSGTAQYTNPSIQSNLLAWRMMVATAAMSGGTLPSPAGTTIYDGGILPYLPTVYILANGSGSGFTQAVATPTVGSANDVALIYPV